MTEDEFLKTYADGIRVPEAIRKRVEAEPGIVSARNLEEIILDLSNKTDFDAAREGFRNYTAYTDKYNTTFEDQARFEVPEYKNWFMEGKVTVPYNQGSCGGCWAFSTAAAVESLAFITGVDEELQEYSIQQLMDCDKDNYGCVGGWMY